MHESDVRDDQAALIAHKGYYDQLDGWSVEEDRSGKSHGFDTEGMAQRQVSFASFNPLVGKSLVPDDWRGLLAYRDRVSHMCPVLKLAKTFNASLIKTGL